MKNLLKLKVIILLTIVALGAVNCNKNQKAVKRLSGQWKSTNIYETIGNNATDLSSQGVSYTFNFNKCKLNKNDYCNYSVTKVAPLNGTTETITDNGFYKITDDGKTMTTTNNITNGVILTYDIVNLTKKKATLRTKTNSGKLEIELVKIK